MSDRDELDVRLQEIEAGSKEYDAGDIAAGTRIARALRAIFHQDAATSPAPLLSRLSGTYTKFASSVVKPPVIGALTHSVPPLMLASMRPEPVSDVAVTVPFPFSVAWLPMDRVPASDRFPV